jgi:hypothetical protein
MIHYMVMILWNVVQFVCHIFLIFLLEFESKMFIWSNFWLDCLCVVVLRQISSPRTKLLAARCECLHLMKMNCLAL